MLSDKSLYAGFWSRLVAFIFDYFIIALYISLTVGVTVGLSSINPEMVQQLFERRISSQVAGFLIMTLPVTLYFAILEASSWQASWGKRMRGLQVTTVDGDRPSFGRSLGRTALKFVPWELAHTCVWSMQFAHYEISPLIAAGLALVGLLVAANALSILFTTQKQALYDRLVGSIVVKIQR